MRCFLRCCAFLALWASVVAKGAILVGASAERVTAISMRGQPKHAQGLTHFSVYNPNAPQGGHVHFAEIKHVFDTVNPFAFGANCAQGVGRYHFLTFDTLMEKAPNEPFSLYGRLAKYVILAPDRSSITFYLDPRARFHDGSPVLASDVKATFEILAERAGPAYKLFHAKIKSIDILGKRIVRIVFHPLAGGNYDKEAPFTVAMRAILSEKDIKSRDFNQDPLRPLMGSGPYTIESVDPGRSITFVRARNYWGRDLPALRGLYNFDRITYDYFSSDVVAFEAFKAGLIDHWVETSPQRWASGYDFPAAKRNAVVRTPVFFKDAAIVTFLVFNLKRAPLHNRHVRLALGGLFDFEWMNKNLHHGTYSRNASHFAVMPFEAKDPITAAEKGALMALPDVPFYAFEPMPTLTQTKGDGNIRPLLGPSQALFKKAGWVYRHGALRHVKTGKPLTLTLVITDRRFEKLALMYKRGLKKAGVTLTIKLVDSAHYQKLLGQRDYDLIITSYGTGLSPGIEQQLYYGSYFADVPSRNHAGVNSKAIDAVIDNMIRADSHEAQVFYCQLLDRLLRVGYYMVPLGYKSSSDVAFWRCLAHPPLKTHFIPSIYAWWWVPGCKKQ
ncbi:ABC transporter substrate-binding protein [bacterium NHP-B]|nr:ABC transporter substrate-binding protein [bacterium NHP-B]